MRPLLSSASPCLRVSVVIALTALSLPAAEPQLHDLTYSGDQSLLAAIDRDLQLAGRDSAKLAALEKRLLAEFTRRDATFAARQALAQRLALVLATSPDPKSPLAKTFAPLLLDARDSDVARLALQPLPGAAIDQLFLDALPKSARRVRIGLLDTIAVRRIARAVAAVTPLLSDSDAATARAAARTLGEIGNAAALAALKTAPLSLTATARLAAATQLPPAEAIPELHALDQATSAPTPIRLAAFRAALGLDPARAASALVAALSSSDSARRQVAAEAIFASRAPDVVATLTAKLSTFDPSTQAAVLSALARRGEAAAVPAALQALTHANAEIRAAAITALGQLPGNREVVAALAQLATADSADDAKLAKQSLARLNGPDVSATIAAGAEKSAPALRAVFLEQLALRNQTEALPLLFKIRTDTNAPAAVRIAAVAALGDIAPLSAQSDLLAWTLAATDEAEQARALRSYVNVALRDPNKDARGQLLFDTLAKAQPDVALRLLPALNRLGTTRAAEAAAQLASRNDAKLADAAASALGRWTDATALPALATVAENSPVTSAQNSARQAALRFLERNRDPWKPEFTATISRLLKATKESSDRKKLVAVLHRANDAAAHDLAKSLSSDSDAALATAAKTAADIIAANQLGQPRLRASGAESSLKNMFDGKTSTRWNVPTEGEEWLEIDFRAPRPLHTITLDQTSRGAEFPEKYELHVTDDPKSPGPVVASGKGQQNKTVIELPANTRGRYVIIKNVAERKDSQWAIVELQVN